MESFNYNLTNAKLILIILITLSFANCGLDKTEHINFTINGENYPNLDIADSTSSFKGDNQNDVHFKASHTGFWDFNDDGEIEASGDSANFKFEFPGIYYISFWQKNPELKITKRIVIEELNSEPWFLEGIVDDKPEIPQPTKPNPNPKPKASTGQNDVDLQLMINAENERKRLEAEQVRLEQEKKAEEQRRLEEQKKAEELRKKQEQEQKFKSLRLTQESTILEPLDQECIAQNGEDVQSATLSIIPNSNTKLKGASLWASNAGKISIILIGPNGERSELVKSVNAGNSSIRFSEWTNLVLTPAETWTLSFKSDQVKLKDVKQCVKMSSKQLKLGNTPFIYNLNIYY